ncbi:type VI secretion system Vgr family protein [Plastoroseomonas arctica]|uniref:Type VI secretion system tip protein VgrG n=1 Tax=Plastoroseomonas arctica TaxID=1509237 RepID=A0AAF1KU56_9PROT|nr:type VI secretion system tip protein TssI/VgrG [Plastoroseomonas arctica]MBR0655527.1 type VI secretion system tip protein VgrG [Plastoroseomonas arctica]
MSTSASIVSSHSIEFLKVVTSLGPDAVIGLSLNGREGISELYNFELVFISNHTDIKPDQLISDSVSIRLMPEASTPRFFHGRIARVSAGPMRNDGFRFYRAEVVPWLAFLANSVDCRIYQDKSTIEIIESVFKNFGFSDYQINLSAAQYKKRTYCVQYRETALDFISRLLEEEGIFYFFRHEESRHVMVLGDLNAVFKDLPSPHNKPRFAPEGSTWEHFRSGEVQSWDRNWHFRPSRWAQRDFNFERPSDRMQADVQTLLKVPRASEFERFDYPGRYSENQQGREMTRRLMEIEEASHHLVEGRGGCAAFCAGGRFALQDYRIPGEADAPHILRRVWHDVREPADHVSGESAGYENRFECFPQDVRFRPAITTRRPQMSGPQTATVTGPAGSEIFTDKHGRVKLRFHWDRNPDANEDNESSCWVRVSHAWAGTGYGSIQIPRIGQEVIVDFLDGDPDRPIVTGRVYNADQMPPHGLPGAAVKSGIKSNSTKGGGGSNELTFDDTKGKEKVYLHAQYDMETVVEHDETQHVINNRKINVDGTHTETIKGITSITVAEGNYTHSVAANTALRSSKNQHKITSTAADVLVTAKTQIKLEVGDSSITMLADGTITIQGKNISILGSDSVTVSSTKVQITGSGEAKIGVGSQATVYDKQKVATSGAAINSAAVGQHEITGAIVKIN